MGDRSQAQSSAVLATVHIVDDDPHVRENLSQRLEAAGLHVVAYDDASAFLLRCGDARPGCLVAELCMRGMSGLELQTELIRRGARWPIIFVTARRDISAAVRAIKDGAADVLTKPVDNALLLGRITGAMAQSEAERAAQAGTSRLREGLAALTDRERQVVQLALAGYSNKEIGRLVGISYRTVEVYRSRIRIKTHTASLLDLAQCLGSKRGC